MIDGFFFFKQKTAYEMRISDWSSDVCSSDLGDENSAQDVGAFNAAVASLQEATGACVVVVHHSGKNKAAGARGSSALLGAIDTEIEIDAIGRASCRERVCQYV